MTTKEKLDKLLEEVEKLKLQKNISLPINEYNKFLKEQKNAGMLFIVNLVLDIINNDGANIKDDETSDSNKGIKDFINIVKKAVKGEKDV
ncbi:MAG: hypothetical protein COB41_00265 [Proteobacteria bacterium]|nr:MAG: hypothetical protein COB41_00265 [Pseudomonadota bacterium]